MQYLNRQLALGLGLGLLTPVAIVAHASDLSF